jgi:hypothetical protein
MLPNAQQVWEMQNETIGNLVSTIDIFIVRSCGYFAIASLQPESANQLVR